MIYIDLPIGSGTIYPATKFSTEKLSTRVSSALSNLSKKKYFILRTACCGYHASYKLHSFFKNRFISITADDLSAIGAELDYPIPISFRGYPLEIIAILNQEGVHCFHDGNFESPILIIPDYFDLQKYKNFRRMDDV